MKVWLGLGGELGLDLKSCDLGGAEEELVVQVSLVIKVKKPYVCYGKEW